MAYAIIDISAGATKRTGYVTAGSTRINIANPANADGIINSFEVWMNTNATGFKIGTFSVKSGDATKYTNRDYEDIGSVTSGSKQTFTGKNCECKTGDYLGSYCATGQHESGTTTGDNRYALSGDQFGTGEQTFNAQSDTSTSIYGTGITVPDAPTSVSASDSTYTDKVVITWTAGTGETGGHRVYRDGVDVSGVVAHGTATYDDTTATAGTTYTYTVKAINDAGLSDASTADNGTRASSGTTSFIQQIMKHHFIPPFIGGILWLVNFHLKRIQPSLCILRFIKATGRSLPIPAR